MTHPDEFASLDLEAIRGTLRWFDAQRGRVGPGVLVTELRAGGKPGWTPQQDKPRSLIERERDYAQSITDWLSQNFPDLDRPRHGPHPAAVAAVIGLHYRDGKGSLTKARHGPEIRAAVRAWESKWSSPTSEGAVVV